MLVAVVFVSGNDFIQNSSIHHAIQGKKQKRKGKAKRKLQGSDEEGDGERRTEREAETSVRCDPKTTTHKIIQVNEQFNLSLI